MENRTTATTHRVYMSFFVRGGDDFEEEWVYQFLELDLKTSIGPIRSTRLESVLRDLIKRCAALTDEEREELEEDFAVGRGGCDLKLTEEQYTNLKRSAWPATPSVKDGLIG
jgi:hypothetical protein